MKANNEIVVLEGRFEPGAPDWIYLPFEVPDGIGEIAVSYSYDTPETPIGLPGNACDIGIFDPSGFRGYSGGARSSFTVGKASRTTPGYVPGPIPTGTWQIMLAPYTIAPAGLSYCVNITLTPYDNPVEIHAEPSYAPERARGRGKTWYRGDLHTHTCHSDGQRTPAELAAAVREAGLDFFVSTEHNTNTAHAEWGEYASDELLILNGEEVTTRNGHLIAAGLAAGTWLDWRFRSVDAGDDGLSSVLQEIHAQRGLAIAAHPHAPCLGCQWKFGYDGIDAIESGTAHGHPTTKCPCSNGIRCWSPKGIGFPRSEAVTRTPQTIQ